MKTLTFPLGDNPEARLVCYLHDQLRPGPALPGAMFCPGGAYLGLSPREGEQIAMTFFGQGYHTFVLYYSVGLRCAWPQPVVEASMAMKILRDHAQEWHLNPDQLMIAGFSAGGHVASGLGVLWNDPEVQRLAGVSGEDNRPDAMLLCYPCINIDMPVFEGDELVVRPVKNEELVGPHTPPAFILHSYGDKMVSMEQSVRFVYAMSKHDRPVEYHVFTAGGHGEMCNPTSAVSQEGLTTPSLLQWLPWVNQWLDELWHPKPAPELPEMFRGAFDTREHFETLVCLIREGMGPAPTELSPQSRLDVIADHPAAMEILREYVPVLRTLRLTETARAFPIARWLEYAGYACGNPFTGQPPAEEVATCMARLRAAMGQ